MSRGMNEDNVEATKQGNVRRVYFARLDYEGLPLYVTSAPFNIEFDWTGSGDVETFVGIGGLGAMSGIEESGTLQSYSVDLELSGLNPAMISLALGETYQGRSAVIWRGFFSSEHVLIAPPDIVFKGRMDTQPLDFPGGKITLTIHSVLQDWERSRVRRYTNEDQQNEYPGDKAFEFVSQMVEKPIRWGQ